MVIRITIDIPECFEHPVLFIMLLYRRLRYGYTFRRIPLTRGMFAIVDPDDYEHLSKFNWHVVDGKETYYAVRIGRKNEKRKGKNIWMHRTILNLNDDQICDHKNHNGLDNRRANLRPVTHSQNMQNRPKRKTKCHSKYKGVSFRKRQNKWVADIQVNSKPKFLGYYDNEIDAARVYYRATKKYHGQYATLNFEKSRNILRRCSGQELRG